MPEDLLAGNNAWSEKRRAEDIEAQRDRLAEFKVVGDFRCVRETPILRKAWSRGADVWVHGLIYEPENRCLRDLGCSIGRGHFQAVLLKQEATQ